MQKVITVSGKPCAGKGTRLRNFMQTRGKEYLVLSCGEMLRNEIDQQTELGKIAKPYVQEGKLVPDYLVINMLLEKIREADKTVILDAFPRTLGQAEALLEVGIHIDRVVNVHAPDSEIIKRAAQRIVCVECGETYTTTCAYKPPKVPGFCDKCGGELHRRHDDNKIEERLQVYNQETLPVLGFLAKHDIPIYTVCTMGYANEDIQFAEAMTIE